MSLYNKIYEDKCNAFRNQNKLENNILTTIVSDMQNIIKEKLKITENEVITILKKFETGILVNLDILKRKRYQVEYRKQQYEKELVIVQRYLPKKLSEQELKTIIINIIRSKFTDTKASIGLIMKELKSNYNSQYDGKLASDIIKKILA